MRTTRVHTQQTLTIGERITLENMPSAHLIRVLRLRQGASVLLFNGDGQDYVGEIIVPKVEAVQVEIARVQPAAAESPLKIWLMQGLCRGEKMDWVLEKATELGVHGFIPVSTERSEVHLDAERATKRLEHWRRVVSSACEQCGRAFVPAIETLESLDRRLTQAFAGDHRLALEPGQPHLLRHAKPGADIGHVILAVGPEGGFSERDLKQMQLAGFQLAGLGPRILRTETAGLAAISALQAQLGDFAG
jgi:16S rRNA (uracil1498-N3)-methyltransferase